MANKPSAKLTKFVPVETFTGYPDGATPVLFRAGVESPPVTEDYAQLMRAKGLVATETQPQNPSEDAPE